MDGPYLFIIIKLIGTRKLRILWIFFKTIDIIETKSEPTIFRILLEKPEPGDANEGGDEDVEDKSEEDQSCLWDVE